MHQNRQKFMREMGTALAVLAIYVLTLLLPLHQAAGLQRDLNALGYSSLNVWSVCQPLVEDQQGDEGKLAQLTCPASGISKHQLSAVLPPSLVIGAPSIAHIVAFVPAYDPSAPVLPDHVGQSRAPPVTA